MKQQLKQTTKKTNSNSQQQEALVRFIQALAQVLQAQPEQVMLIALANPQALELAIQAFQSTLDINQAAQAFTQASLQAAQKAAHGTKLNYIRKITNRCADDEETYFYKVGGKIGCGCKKKEQGGKVADNGKSIIARFKEKCGGKMKKHQLGGNLNGLPFMLSKGNSWTLSRRKIDLGNGYQTVSDWIYQDTMNGQHTGDYPPTVGGRTIYVSPTQSDTIYWITPDKWIWNDHGLMPTPAKTKNLLKAKTNFYKLVKKTKPTPGDKESDNARKRALKGN